LKELLDESKAATEAAAKLEYEVIGTGMNCEYDRQISRKASTPQKCLEIVKDKVKYDIKYDEKQCIMGEG